VIEDGGELGTKPFEGVTIECHASETGDVLDILGSESHGEKRTTA
jgi:hypothetical protein